MALSDLLYSFLYYISILFSICVVFAMIAIVLLRMALKKRQRDLEKKTGTLDLTGETFRAHLKTLAKELQGYNPVDELGYDPTSTECLTRFAPIKFGTQCAFAKSAKLWGNPNWDESLSLEANVERCVEPVRTFLRVGKGLHLEGFLIEIRGREHGVDVSSFGDAVRRGLTVLSDKDPKGGRCMSKSYIGKRGWWFEFDNEPIFVTSFAPCYPVTHSRYGFEAPKDSVFILLQPEYSFAWKNVEDNRELKTNWENPESARDKIRVAFKSAGRNYIKEGEPYDPIGAHQIVKPIGLYDDELQWWKPKTV